MAYIAGIVIVGLLFLTLHYFTELTHKQKALVSALVLAVVLSAVAFNTYTNAKTKRMLSAVMKFNQHKDIECDGVIVNDTNFTLSIGTYTFIGKENTQNYAQMISASTCK